MSHLAAVADTVTKTIIASVSLIAAVLVVLGLARAWAGRRRAQVVIEDVVPLEGFPGSVVAGLSPLLRQEVRRALKTQSTDAGYAHLTTMADDVTSGLLANGRATTVSAVRTELQATARDSLTALSAGVRALAPKEADGILAVLGSCLPAQRGYLVKAFPSLRGLGADGQVGLTLEFAELGRAPDAVTTFWSSASVTGTPDDRAAAVHNTLNELIEPAALWIAIRLVAQYLSHTTAGSPAAGSRGGSSRGGPSRGGRSKAQLSGLRAQLTGQMSLYATRNNERFDRSFADQALEDLADAARLLPGYFRPHSTQAAVQERVGWSHRQAGRTASASKAFRAAVRAYDQADDLLAKLSAQTDGAMLSRTRQAIAVRRTKSRLLCDDAAQTVVAVRELAAFCEPSPSTMINLYNAACLLAVALTVAAGAAQQRSGWERLSWQLLGRSLLVGGPEGPWNLMLGDVELEYLDQQARVRFAEKLKERRPEMTSIPDDEARLLVDEVLGEVLG